MSTFRERLYQLWEEAKDQNHDLTQTQFAERFKATRNQFTGWLDGRGEPDTEALKIIASVNNVSTSWLLGETDIRLPYGVIDSTKQFTEETKKELNIESVQHEMKDGINEKELTPEQLKMIKATITEVISELKKQG
jgi:transcriptional regulator with XRE-family HTH domain